MLEVVLLAAGASPTRDGAAPPVQRAQLTQEERGCGGNHTDMKFVGGCAYVYVSFYLVVSFR